MGLATRSVWNHLATSMCDLPVVFVEVNANRKFLPVSITGLHTLQTIASSLQDHFLLRHNLGRVAHFSKKTNLVSDGLARDATGVARGFQPLVRAASGIKMQLAIPPVVYSVNSVV